MDNKKNNKKNKSLIPNLTIQRINVLKKKNRSKGLVLKNQVITTVNKNEIKRELFRNFVNLPKVPQIFFDKYESINITNHSNNEKENNDVNKNIENRLKNMSIIDYYYVLDYEFNKLKSFKEMMLNVLNGLQMELKNADFEININPNNDANVLSLLILNKFSFEQLFGKNIGSTVPDEYNFSNFQTFVDKVKNNNFNLFNFTGASSNKYPVFYSVLNKNKFGQTKDFILNMMKEYLSIRNFILSNFIKNKNYYGLLAFSTFFTFNDITSPITIIQKSQFENKFNFNSEVDPIYNRIRTSSNIFNNDLKANNTESVSQSLVLTPKDNLYEQLGNEQILYIQHQNNIKQLYNKMTEKLKLLYTSKRIDLYNFVVESIELDFTLIEFLLYFVRDDLFQLALNRKKVVYQFIQTNIQIYYDNIEDFDSWINQYLLNIPTSGFLDSDMELKDSFIQYNEYYKRLFELSEKERLQENKNKISNKDISIIIKSDDSSGAQISDQELNELERLESAFKSYFQQNP